MPNPIGLSLEAEDQLHALNKQLLDVHIELYNQLIPLATERSKELQREKEQQKTTFPAVDSFVIPNLMNNVVHVDVLRENIEALSGAQIKKPYDPNWAQNEKWIDRLTKLVNHQFEYFELASTPWVKDVLGEKGIAGKEIREKLEELYQQHPERRPESAAKASAEPTGWRRMLRWGKGGGPQEGQSR